MSEFTLIDRYFRNSTVERDDVVLGIGDDAALLQVPPGHQLVVSTDTLVEGVHFPAGTDPEAIGHKALAVNISDLAAMGAMPAWATLALTLPEQSADWLSGFMGGFNALAKSFKVALVGGDTTRGPLTITVQIMGHLPIGRGLRRDGANPGDRVFVTGQLGDAALVLHLIQQGLPNNCGEASLRILQDRLDRPQPRVSAGLKLLDLATSAIDLSDGLLSDLEHIGSASSCGVKIFREQVPCSAVLTAWSEEQKQGAENQSNNQLASKFLLNGGDDYELCFTVPASRIDWLEREDWGHCGGVTEIGIVTQETGLLLVDGAGAELTLPGSGYDHFR